MRRCMSVLSVCLLAVATPGATLAAGRPKPAADWPCRQILVGHLSPAAFWTGPSIDGLDLSNDTDIVALADKLAARRVPIDEAKAEVDAFAKNAGADKRDKLTKLFAALFGHLDRERAEVIAGLERFGHIQKVMADRIRAENDKLQAERALPTPPQPQAEPAKPAAPDDAGAAHPADGQANAPTDPLEHLQWDLRLFEERRHTLNYVCDVPTAIEQRLFALAHAIQDHLD